MAAFAQKYNAPNLQQEADRFLAESVGFVPVKPNPDHRNNTIASLDQIKTWDILDYTGAAEDFKLPLFQQKCLKCLKDQRGMFARHQRRLEQLSSCVLVALLISVA